MRQLSPILFWIGIIAIPVSLLFWFLQPDFTHGDYGNIVDPAVREAYEISSSQRMAIFVGMWAPTMLILSSWIDRKYELGLTDKWASRDVATGHDTLTGTGYDGKTRNAGTGMGTTGAGTTSGTTRNYHPGSPQI